MGQLEQLKRQGGMASSGLNPFIREAIKQNPEFLELLAMTERHIIETLAENVFEIQVAVNCRRGKHRPVSFAEELRARLAELEDRFEPTALHIERPRWDHEYRRSINFPAQTGIKYPVPARFGVILIRRAGNIEPLSLECNRGRCRRKARW